MLSLVNTLEGHGDRVWCVAWNPKGNMLASSGTDKTVKLWSYDRDTNQCKCIDTLTEGHTRTIRWVSWSPCGTKLATASFDSSITIWKKKHFDNSFEIVANLEGHENEVKCVAWSSDGDFLASCSRDKSVWIWDVCEDDEYECSAVMTTHSQDVKHVAWMPMKNVLVSTSYDNTLKIFKQEYDDWTCVETLESHESTVWSCDFNKDATKIISCSDDKTLKIWKEFTENNNEGIHINSNSKSKWKSICTISGYHHGTIFDVKWCNLTDLIATASADNSIHIFKEEQNNNELQDQPSIRQQAIVDQAHEQDVNCISWNPVEPGILASCSDDGTIKLWRFNEN